MSTTVLAELMESIDRCEVTFAASEPRVQAFLPEPDRFGRLRREAEALLARYPDVRAHPPLFGTLVGVKDIFHVDGFDTRAGSRLPPEVLRGPQAESVRRLKNAGALILGKTVTTEFAYFVPGPTRNPHNLDHTPGGSSSGSAAAVAADFCRLALGTQTIGSIIRPETFAGWRGKPWARLSKVSSPSPSQPWDLLPRIHRHRAAPPLRMGGKEKPCLAPDGPYCRAPPKPFFGLSSNLRVRV
jgi:Asp-tRNA(Asn)/Glu-tRNA(Gln) amidotransferase A subunit family amidase